MLQTEILANIIYRFDDQYFLTSKTGLYLKDLRTASEHPVQGCVDKHLSAPGLPLEKISVSRGEAKTFGKFSPAERPGNSL